MAAEPGFEPGQKDSKSFVLPLHNGAIDRLSAIQFLGYCILYLGYCLLVPKVGLEPTRGFPLNSF